MPSIRTSHAVALVAALLLMATPLLSAPALAAPGDKRHATITAHPFTDSCRDVSFHSTKDISHVEIHYADGRVIKDESTTTPDHTIDGGAGDEIDFVIEIGHDERDLRLPGDQQPADCGIREEGRQLRPAECSGHLDVRRLHLARLLLHAPGSTFTDERAVSFRGISSTDPDNDIVNWSIDFGDGTTPAGGSWAAEPPVEVVHEYNIECTCTVTLTVTDSAGQSSSDPMAVSMIFFDTTD
ncbi:MAG: PKD domain-containing protein [Actinobacteria bacterium]|nr:PKD domain-containing protein [Actinomycetota bacterium]